MKWRLSLAYPILALVSFAALAVALPLYFISVNSLKKSVEAMELSKAIQIHHIAEAAIANEVNKLTALSKTLEKNRALTEALKHFNNLGDSDALRSVAESIVTELDVGFVKIAGRNEQTVCRCNSTIIAEPNIWGVVEALQGREIITTSRHDEGFVIQATAPVRDQNREILGAITVGFIINNAFADRISSVAGANILIGSQQGIIAASHSIQKDKERFCGNDSFVHDMILESIKDNKALYKTICRNNQIYYYKRLLIVNEMFSVMVEVNTSDSQELYSATRRQIAATAGVAFVIAWFLGITLTGTIIRPLQELRDQSCNTVKDITGKTIDVHSGNELDALVCAFKIMKDSLVSYIADLKEAESELREHRDHLEELVAERTENLEKTNEQLNNEINDRERAEQELKDLNRKLNNSNQQLQEFVHVASHDLREPLRKISAFTQMLTDSLSGRLNDDERENFGFVLEGTVRMRKIIETLLVYSRLMNQKTRFEEIDLNKIIEELRNFELRVKLRETNGRLVIPQPLPVIKGDAAQIWQLFQNLIVNALKYHKEGVAPQVIIRAHEQEDDMVRIEIEDNGIGIKLQYRQSIFAMFRRLHRGNKYDGIGAGLAICKKIIEQHNGVIGMNSTYGQGTTFWFTLPAAGSQQKEKVEPSVSYKE